MARKTPPRAPAPVLPPAAPERTIVPVEWIVAALLTGLIIYAHVELFRHAGGLWRDEANSVAMASLPTMADTWHNNEFDSFPILWFVVLRGYLAAGLGSSDLGLRALGLAVGLAVLASFWLAGRRLGRFVPVVALALFALNPEMLRWGDSLRAYGFGVILLLATIWLVWEYVRQPTPWRAGLAALVAVVSVQAVFYNSVLLAAAIAGGVAVMARRRQWRQSALLIAVGIPAALSLLFYAPMIQRAGSWNVLCQIPFSGAILQAKVAEVMAAPGEFMLWAWGLLAALAIVAALVVQWPRVARSLSPERRDLALFALVTLLTGSAGYLLFLFHLHYPTQPWYYVSLIALAALCLDTMISAVFTSALLRYLRLAVVALLVVCALPQVWPSIQKRQTDLDLVAAKLNAEAVKGDLVVVASWSEGVSFDRYYRGPAEWVTVPPIDFHKYHRYDLVKPLMSVANPNAATLTKMAEAINSGHRVWVVGNLARPQDPNRLPVLPPPPLPGTDWQDGPYNQVWAAQIAYGLMHTASGMESFRFGDNVNFYENEPLLLFRK